MVIKIPTWDDDFCTVSHREDRILYGVAIYMLLRTSVKLLSDKLWRVIRADVLTCIVEMHLHPRNTLLMAQKMFSLELHNVHIPSDALVT